jgi:hypothetical protein
MGEKAIALTEIWMDIIICRPTIISIQQIASLIGFTHDKKLKTLGLVASKRQT